MLVVNVNVCFVVSLWPVQAFIHDKWTRFYSLGRGLKHGPVFLV